MKDEPQQIDKKHRRSLNKSHGTVGQLYPVLRDAEGKVIDGWHRLDVDPAWQSVTLPDMRAQ